ncbi:hypothetical protein MRX96_030753 [Rhipicephalus microplus]
MCGCCITAGGLLAHTPPSARVGTRARSPGSRRPHDFVAATGPLRVKSKRDGALIRSCQARQGISESWVAPPGTREAFFGNWKEPVLRQQSDLIGRAAGRGAASPYVGLRENNNGSVGASRLARDPVREAIKAGRIADAWARRRLPGAVPDNCGVGNHAASLCGPHPRN